MSRTLFFAVASLALLTLASSFAAASGAPRPASDGLPQLRPNLPVAALPTIPLDEATRGQLSKVIDAQGVARFGITPGSFARVRRLADTSVGTFYLVAGTRGACIVTLTSASCGDPGSDGAPGLALAKATPTADVVVGVGIATAGTDRIAMPTGSGVASLPVSGGLFHIRERPSLPATGGQGEPNAGSAPKRSKDLVGPSGPDPGGGGGGGSCTHYSHPYGIYPAGDWQCDRYETIWPGHWATSGVAIRLQNKIFYEHEFDWWTLWYTNGDGSDPCCFETGWGTYGIIGDSQWRYMQAHCSSPNASWDTRWSMFCTTIW